MIRPQIDFARSINRNQLSQTQIAFLHKGLIECEWTNIAAWTINSINVSNGHL
jgi:hypothetical protein